MFKKANQICKNIKADFIATGEVLDQRPFSQRKKMMLYIEKNSGLQGKIVRPLSAGILPPTEPEKNGLVDRNKFLSVKGRRRIPQIELAKRLGIKDYPCPSGGCLLTDPRFSDRLRDHLKFNEKLSHIDIVALKIGRHFRIGRDKIIVGRNEEENNKLCSIARTQMTPWLEALNYNGPVTLVWENDSNNFMYAASITARYSDAPEDSVIKVICRYPEEKTIETKPIDDDLLRVFRI
jgi:tRNA U34 2-thiouridine synthase MnmA/TrmU